MRDRLNKIENVSLILVYMYEYAYVNRAKI